MRHASHRCVTLLAALVLAGCAGDAGILSPVDDGAQGPNPLAGARFFVDPASPARATADAWRTGRPLDAAQIDKIAQQPVTRWFGPWNTDVRADVDAAATASIGAGAVPVFVAFNMPQVGCGGPSGTNTTTADGYRAWISQLALGLGSRRAAVILEPDALGGMDCLTAAQQQQRLELFRHAVQALTASGTVAVYLDAGNPRWQPAAVMASRLRDAGIASARGFALNVANFLTTDENVAYGAQLSSLVGGKHFVIDTGRNGAGSNGEWCNPAGRALGARPTGATGHPLVDALLWVKLPGESDGACNGAARAGEWLPEYALGLAQRAAY
jgi:endoglucanase